jgi:hypothetical protein
MDDKNKQEKSIGQWGPRQKQYVDPNRQWASQSRRYEWKDTYDDIAPADPELEHELFGEDNHVPTGINFSKYQEIKVTVKPENRIRPVESVSFSKYLSYSTFTKIFFLIFFNIHIIVV